MLIFIFIPGWSTASDDYRFITAKDLNDRINSENSPTIIDICTVEQYTAGHIKGAIETNAYPVKTDAEKAKLAEQLPMLKSSEDAVVIVCPRGAGGAKRTYDFYKSFGIDENRLYILENGMDGWPFESENK